MVQLVLPLVYHNIIRTSPFDHLTKIFIGETVALASISGPIEVRQAYEHPSQATFEVSVRPLSNVAATDSKSIASTIRSLLTPSVLLSHHPRASIQLVVQAVSPSPAKDVWRDVLVSAMINASTLALLNSGSIPMRGVVCAVSVGRVGSSLLVDPSADEVAVLEAGGCFAFLFAGSGPECVWSNWKTASGTAFEEEEVVKAKEMAKVAAAEVWAAVKASIYSAGTDASLVKKDQKPVAHDDDDKMEI